MEQKNPELIRKYTGIMYFIIGIAFAVALFFNIKALAMKEFINQIFAISTLGGILIVSTILLYIGKDFLSKVEFKNRKHKIVVLSTGSLSILCIFNGIIFGSVNTCGSLLSPWKIPLLHIQMGSLMLGAVLFYILLWIDFSNKK